MLSQKILFPKQIWVRTVTKNIKNKLTKMSSVFLAYHCVISFSCNYFMYYYYFNTFYGSYILNNI